MSETELKAQEEAKLAAEAKTRELLVEETVSFVSGFLAHRSALCSRGWRCR